MFFQFYLSNWFDKLLQGEKKKQLNHLPFPDVIISLCHCQAIS